MCADWPTKCSSGFHASMCWSTTSAGTGTPVTSPLTGSSEPSPSTISQPFLLTDLLLARLQQRDHARVVTVASHAHAQGRIDFDDLQGERSYSGARAYNQSKLASVLFSYELARRLRGSAVTANAVHPGVVSTSFGAEDPGRTQRLLVPILRPFMKSAERGAATSIHVASAPQLQDVTGRYFTNSQPRKSSATKPRPGRSHTAVAGKRRPGGS